MRAIGSGVGRRSRCPRGCGRHGARISNNSSNNDDGRTEGHAIYRAPTPSPRYVCLALEDPNESMTAPPNGSGSPRSRLPPAIASASRLRRRLSPLLPLLLPPLAQPAACSLRFTSAASMAGRDPSGAQGSRAIRAARGRGRGRGVLDTDSVAWCCAAGARAHVSLGGFWIRSSRGRSRMLMRGRFVLFCPKLASFAVRLQ